MKIQFCNKKSDTGFIYVASCNKLFYELALISCQSLKDFYPDANVTLFTHENFLDKRVEIFDQVITEIPIHVRAKMWCMARTPYKKTLYNDCDSIIRHKDVNKIHDFLDGYDMFFGSQLTYTVSDYRWAFIDKAGKINVKYHGSLCGYGSSEFILQFMQDWFDEYLKQRNSPWIYENYHSVWQQFDMFTLWRMTSGVFPEFDKYKNIKINIIPRRFNNSCVEIQKDIEGKPVITQVDKMTVRRIETLWKNISSEMTNGPNFAETKKITGSTYEFD